MNSTHAHNESLKVLFVGSLEKVFGISFFNFVNGAHCTNIPEGIQAAERKDFHILAIQLADIEGRPDHALEAFRKACPNASIILLTSMIQEPLARKLTQTMFEGTPLADEYLICPIEPSELYNHNAQQPALTPLQTDLTRIDLIKRVRLLEKLTTQDDLTGLKNRRYILQFLDQTLDLSSHCGLHVTLLIFDIDDFKKYNDFFGHSIGDQVLIQAGKLISHCCRAHDVVARIGGDEFSVVFWDLPDQPSSNMSRKEFSERRTATGRHPKDPWFMAERFRKEINDAHLPYLGPYGKGSLTISGGLASFPQDGKTVQDLFQKADQALMEAKQTGKNKIVLVGNTSGPE